MGGEITTSFVEEGVTVIDTGTLGCSCVTIGVTGTWGEIDVKVEEINGEVMEVGEILLEYRAVFHDSNNRFPSFRLFKPWGCFSISIASLMMRLCSIFSCEITLALEKSTEWLVSATWCAKYISGILFYDS